MNQGKATADSLQLLAYDRLREIAEAVSQTIGSEAEGYVAYATEGKRNSEKATFNYIQIVHCAKRLEYFANLSIYQAWAALIIQTGHRTELLFSFHGIGRGTGVLGCAAMIYNKQLTDSGESMATDVEPLADEPFEFTLDEDRAKVQQRFRKWVGHCALVGLQLWKDTV